MVPATTGTVGYLGIRLQRDRRHPDLPVPGVRRVRTWVSSGDCRGSGRRPVCVRAGADGRTREGVSRTWSDLACAGFEGEYGFYEAIDYTPSRLAREETHAVVKSYMAHHQGMSLLSSRLSAAGPTHAAPLSRRPDGQGDRAPSAGTRSRGRCRSSLTSRSPACSDTSKSGRRCCAYSPIPTRPFRRSTCCRTAGTTSW